MSDRCGTEDGAAGAQRKTITPNSDVGNKHHNNDNNNNNNNHSHSHNRDQP